MFSVDENLAGVHWFDLKDAFHYFRVELANNSQSMTHKTRKV